MTESGGTHRWPEIYALLTGALDLEPRERAPYLDAHCTDAGLRAEVESLLEADRRSTNFLDQTVGAFAAPLVEELTRSEPLPGLPADTRIGPFRIVRELGRGGMGAVYLAERADGQFEQTAALKLVKRGLDTDEVLDRFRSERQILARLQHPAIAGLLDGGVTDAGLPWFAMEFVEGEPIDRFCERGALDVEDRIMLFLRVCEAVQYAHRNLVVHRDLKPSNMLVSRSGQVKLLDFGIAKLLDQESESRLTRIGVRVMTPQYAAPEQQRGEAVTTLADVYALGVVLHELLTGARPIPRDRYSADVTAPSHIKRPSAAARAGVERLARRLSVDLQTIIAKALHPDPNRRYASVEALANDLRRHLEGLPVEARPDSVGYRARKFVGRHRVGVAATALVGVSLVAGLAGTAWQARRASAQAARAETVKDFLVGLFEASSPEEARGDRLTARQILDRGVRRLDAELAMEPEVHTEMLGVVGDLYRELGLLDEAEPLLQRFVEQSREVYGDHHARVGESLERFGVLLLDRGAYEQAERTLRDALSILEAALGVADPAVSETLTSLATVLSAQGRYEEAASLHHRALRIDEGSFGHEHVRVATDMTDLAITLWYQGDYEEAEPLYREALALRERLLGPDHPDVAHSAHSYATFLSDLGRYDEARPLFERALRLRRKLYGDDHELVAVTAANYGVLLNRMGAYAEAEAMAVEAVAIRRRALGEGHPDLATSLNNLATLRYAMGKYAEAEAPMREALSIWRAELGPDHPSIAAGINNIGAILREQGRFDEAEPLLTEALAIRRKALGEGHPSVAQSYNNLGLLAFERGDVRAADSLLAEAVRRSRHAYPAGHPRLAESLLGLGQVRLAQRRLEEAKDLLEESVVIRMDRLGPDHWRTAEARLALGLTMMDLGQPADAEANLAAAYSGLASRSDRVEAVRRALTALVEVCEVQGKTRDAARYRSELAEISGT